MGSVQRQFHDDVMKQLAADPARLLRIAPSRFSDCWLLERFVAGVPSYRGVALAGRIEVVGCAGGAVANPTLLMMPSGRLLDASSQ